MSIKIRIREVAVSRGIKTAYRLQKTADLAPSSAARLFRNEVKEISVETMTKLCDALDCEPGELFVRPKSGKNKLR
jgi:putative transcriptional regulator